jgi:tRNA(Ile)-lysidine synthase
MDKLKFRAATWQNLIRFERANAFFKSGDKVLAGLSGGADSAALLHFLKQLASRKRFEVCACHVNHGLRAQAARDAAFARRIAAEAGVPFILKKVNVKALARKEKLSAEHAARKARYKALDAAAKKLDCGKIALGHHLDDHIETILLNLLRGTKAKGLLGIPARRAMGRRQIVRPLLCITRGEVLDYIKAHNLSFINDETNFEDIYTRNWVRRKLLPLLESRQPRIRRHLALMAADLAEYIQNR